MKKNIAIGLLLFYLLMLFCARLYSNQNMDNVQSKYELENSKLKKELDTLGRETVSLQGTLLSEKTLKETNIKELEKFKKELKKTKDLVAYYSINKTVSDTIYTRVSSVVYDTVIVNGFEPIVSKTKSFSYIDQWTDLSGKIRETPNKDDSISIMYSIDADVEILHAWKRPGFLKRKVPTITIKYNNPNIRTDDVKTIIKRPKKRFFLFRLFGL